MQRRWLTVALVAAIALLVVAWSVGPAVLVGVVGPTTVDGDDGTVTVADGQTGTVHGQVDVDVAETHAERVAGLSNVDHLPADRGMLFVFDDEATRTFVMREMAIDLDIVFVAANGTITEIHEARAPGPDEDGADLEYRGRAQLVLEVNRGWSADHGVTVGDRATVERAD
ncbi:MAG: DUF192 domain-containing protein [Halobacteriales archaeon]